MWCPLYSHKSVICIYWWFQTNLFSCLADNCIGTGILICSFWLPQVQERSNEICLQLYEKEQLTDQSYLHIYGFVCCYFQLLNLVSLSGKSFFLHSKYVLHLHNVRAYPINSSVLLQDAGTWIGGNSWAIKEGPAWAGQLGWISVFNFLIYVLRVIMGINVGA
jgi:hypothetical protein